MDTKATTVEDYILSFPTEVQERLQLVRQLIKENAPEAMESISYGMPAFRLQGKVVAGFAAFKNHLSYLPHSGHVLDKLPAELAHYSYSTGALRFAIDEPLPKQLVQKLIEIRLEQLGL